MKEGDEKRDACDRDEATFSARAKHDNFFIVVKESDVYYTCSECDVEGEGNGRMGKEKNCHEMSCDNEREYL